MFWTPDKDKYIFRVFIVDSFIEAYLLGNSILLTSYV